MSRHMSTFHHACILKMHDCWLHARDNPGYDPTSFFRYFLRHFWLCPSHLVTCCLSQMEDSINICIVSSNTISNIIAQSHVRPCCMQAHNCQFLGSWKEGQFADGKWVHRNGTMFQGSFNNSVPVCGIDDYGCKKGGFPLLCVVLSLPVIMHE